MTNRIIAAAARGLPLLVCLLAPAAARGQADDAATLTLERIFASSDFKPKSYGPIVWLNKLGGYAMLQPSDPVKGAEDIVRIDPATGKQEVLVSAVHLVPKGESKPLEIEEFHISGDDARILIFTNSQRVWRKNTRGDYWVFDITSRDLIKLGGDVKPSTLMFARFSPDGKQVAYVRDRNLYVEDLASHKVRQLTKSGSPTVINGTFDWVYEEEFALYDGFRWSPNSQMIAFWQLDTGEEDDYYLVNNTAGLYQELMKYKYPKVGRPNARARIGVCRADGASLRADDPGDARGAWKWEKGGDILWLAVEGDPGKFYIPWMDWTPDSREVLIQHLNRLQNTNDLVFANPATADLATHPFSDSDKAWVDVNSSIHWFAGGSKFTWVSERSGWKHVYAVNRANGQHKAMTTGKFDVIDVLGLDPNEDWFYYTASPDNPTQKFLYRVHLNGTGTQRLTPADARGTHDYQISPDFRWAIHTWSTFDQPPVIELVQLPEHKVVRTLVDNAKVKEKLKALKQPAGEFFRVDIGEGVELDGWFLKPRDFDPAKRYPVVFFVYGEPFGQTVLDRWGGTFYLWHLYLTQQGYIVASVENRGTPAPRGREWRKSVYRQVGILGPRDQAAAAKALTKKWSFLDPARIGIWGWSGGGSSSLHAIFQYSDVYQTAMAIAPVGNQRYYDTIYQERYMGLPDDNVAGYRDGSPVTHAHKLKGNLLIVHGTGDDNVHYANTEAVVDELIAHNKEFTMMAYPNRSHSINEGVNTRRHLFTLLTRYLKEHLPAGPK
jgi:dipeptidyl-peptidase-4